MNIFKKSTQPVAMSALAAGMVSLSGAAQAAPDWTSVTAANCEVIAEAGGGTGVIPIEGDDYAKIDTGIMVEAGSSNAANGIRIQCPIPQLTSADNMVKVWTYVVNGNVATDQEAKCRLIAKPFNTDQIVAGSAVSASRTSSFAGVPSDIGKFASLYTEVQTFSWSATILECDIYAGATTHSRLTSISYK